MPGIVKTALGVAVLSGAVGGLYVLNDMTRGEDGKSRLHVAKELPINVQAGAPTRRDIVRSVQAPGEIEAFEEVAISAEVVGKILEMPVEEGDLVRKGDLLCRLDDADYRARVLSAEASVAKLNATVIQGEADFDKAERDYQRQLRLFESNATSDQEIADYKTALVRAKAGLEIRRQELIESQARLQSAKEDLEKTVITSPIDGVVSQRFAKQGEVVVTGTMNNPGTRIMMISDLSKMQVRCRVDEGDAPLVKDGQPARIFLQSDTQKPIAGHVLRVATKGTKPQGRDVVTFETLVLVDALEDRIKPGMASNVEIEVARSVEALTIPIEAVVHRKRRDLPEDLLKQLDEQKRPDADAPHRRAAEFVKIVFTIDGDAAQARFIETGISDETSVEVLTGVAAEEKLAVGPYRSLDQLKQGSKVKIDEPGDKKKVEEAQAKAPEKKDDTKTAASDDKKDESKDAGDKTADDDKDTGEKSTKGDEPASDDAQASAGKNE